MTSLYESLSLKLANVIELAIQDQGSGLTPQLKQALVRSVRTTFQPIDSVSSILLQTREFKDGLREANEYAATLPGGEMSVEEQDEVILMLEKLKERKKYAIIPRIQSISLTSPVQRKQLAEFADRVGKISTAKPDYKMDYKMEVDSTASTPA